MKSSHKERKTHENREENQPGRKFRKRKLKSRRNGRKGTNLGVEKA